MTGIVLGLIAVFAFLYLIGGRELAGLTTACAIVAFLLVTFFHGSLAGVL